MGVLGRLAVRADSTVSIHRPAVRTGSHVGRTHGQYARGNLSSRAVRMVVEGYPPDESLQWDETTHMISLWVEVDRSD